MRTSLCTRTLRIKYAPMSKNRVARAKTRRYPRAVCPNRLAIKMVRPPSTGAMMAGSVDDALHRPKSLPTVSSDGSHRCTPDMIREDPERQGAEDGSHQRQHRHRRRGLHKIGDMRHVRKIVLDKCHKQAESHHNETAREEDPDEVVVTPGFQPVTHQPMASSNLAAHLCLDLLNFPGREGSLAHTNNGDHDAHEQCYRGPGVVIGSTTPDNATRGDIEADLAQ